MARLSLKKSQDKRKGSAPRRIKMPEPIAMIRVSKLMSEQGICSRREADDYITKGWVFVNGERVEELGTRAPHDAKIVLAQRGGFAKRKVTVLLNKPVGVVSGQAEDGYKPAITLIKPENRFPEDPSRKRFVRQHLKGLAPAGRLDIDSTGLLVFTQDGRIAKKLIGQDTTVEKEYLVRVVGELSDDGLRLLNHGLKLDNKALKPAKVSWINDDQLRFVLREGKKRQIRRMCKQVGLEVVGLKRVRIGRVKLSKLAVGQWRFLGDREMF